MKLLLDYNRQEETRDRNCLRLTSSCASTSPQKNLNFGLQSLADNNKPRPNHSYKYYHSLAFSIVNSYSIYTAVHLFK